MTGQVTVRINKKPLEALLLAMPGRNRETVKKTALAMRDRAQALAHIRTGAMRASIYVAASSSDTDYPQATAEASRLNPRAQMDPQVLPPDAGNRNRAGVVVGVAVNYAVYEEVVRAHKFMLPAAEAIQPAFIQSYDDLATV